MRKLPSLARKWFFLVLVFVLIISRSGAQQTEPKLPMSVTLDVAVLERNGQPVRDLAKEEFAVYEDGVKQQLDAFEKKLPLSLGLVIDASGSMRDKLGAVQNAVFRAITRLRQEDEAFLAQFKAEPELLEAFTNDQHILAKALRQVRPTGGTSLLDAILASSDYAEEKGKHSRKALLIVTDGLEKNSASKEKEVTTGLMEGRVQVYFIFLPDKQDESGLFGKSPVARGKELITRLAQVSGGRAFFPSQIGEASTIAEEIMEILQQQYQIRYTPSNPKQDGEWRKVKVEITPKIERKLTVITTQGYFAPGHITQKEKERQKEKEKQEKKEKKKNP